MRRFQLFAENGKSFREIAKIEQCEYSAVHVSYTHLDVYKETGIHPEKLITHRFTGLESVEPALMLMKDKPKDLIKPLVVME